MSHLSESTVGLLFGAAFGLAVYLVNRSGPRGGAPSKCGPQLNPTFDGPIGVPLPEDGKSIWICRCGQSKNPPYCDGSHNAYNAANGTKFVPFEANRKNQGADVIWVCQCGLSKKRNEEGIPICDGSHKLGQK